MNREVKEANGSEMDLVMRLASEVFNQEFFSDIKARRPMWQMMYGGVFDRHPDLRLVLTEIRLDWIPTMLAYLDALFDEHRADIPAKRPPASTCASTAWPVRRSCTRSRWRCATRSASRPSLFGRDYPHPESTWPNTLDWLRDAFAGVPERRAPSHARRERHPDSSVSTGDVLAAIAEQIGPTVQDITGGIDCRSRAARHVRWPQWLPEAGRRRRPHSRNRPDARRTTSPM